MKVINKTNNTIYVDDIDMYIPYHEDGEPQEISPDTLKKSRALRSFILQDMLDVVEYDAEERIESSLMYLRHKMASKLVPKKSPKKIALPEPVALESNGDDIEVRIHGIFFDAGGYGKVNRQLALGLNDIGFKVKVDPKRSKNQLNEDELKPIVKLQDTVLSRDHILIDSIIPSFAEMSTGKYRILYSTIESYTVPQQFVDACELYNEIWLTSSWSASILRKYVDKPIYHVVTGADPKLYNESGPHFDFSPNINDFVFMTVFGWNYRKGYDVLLKAYFDEFSENDPVSLLIVSRYQSGQDKRHRMKIKEDIDKIMVQFPNKDLPHVVRYSKITPERDMPKLYRSSDCFVLPTRGEGGCVKAGTQIITDKGLMGIESIPVNTKVLTHHGRFMPVTDTRCRYTNERIYTIKTSINGRNIQLTGEHPVRVLCRNKTIKNGKKNKQAFSNENAEWKLPNEIDSGDYVLMPLNFCSNDNADHIFVSDYVTNIKVRDGIATRTTSRDKFTWECGNSKNCKDKINIDSSFLQMIGFYIAEGSSTKKGTVRFDFHNKETDYHSIVVKSIDRHFNDTLKHIPDTRKDNRQHRYRLQSHNVVLGEFLRNICGHGAHNKHVPEFAWQLSKSQIFDLLYGMFGGDGSFYQPKISCSPELTLSTVSSQLANDVMLLLRSIGISPCLKITKKRGYVVLIKGNQLNDMNGINGSFFNGEIKEKSVRTKKYVFIPVKEISHEKHDGSVYNLEVEKDNSYTTNCFTVHNCLPPIEASLCGLPVIMTNCSGQQGYLRPDNAYLLEIDHLSEIQAGQFNIHYWDGQQFPALTSKGVHDQLRKHMRQVVDNYDEAKSRNRKLQHLILNDFTWNNTANSAAGRLREIWKQMKGQ